MAWTTPATFTVGEVVTASKLNTHIRDNLRYLKGLDGAVTIESALVVSGGSVDARGAVSETAIGADSARIGVASGTPRIVLEDASATVWQMDNNGGVYRLFTPGVVRMALNAANGNAGFGVDTPAGALHAVQSPGGFLVFCRTGIGATPVQIVTGASRRISLWGVAHRVSGGLNQIVNGSSAISGSTADIFTDGGTNTLRVTNTAGTVTVARAAGSDTYEVVLFCAYQ